MTGPPDLVLAALHWLEYLGLLGGVGSLVIRRLGRIGPRIGWADPPMHVAFGAALLGGLGVLAFGPDVLIAARVVAEGLALFLCLSGRPPVLFAVLAPVLLPLSSHAALVQPQPTGAELADALHVLSAGMWAGGVLALASLAPPQGWKSPEGRALLDRFGRVALIAFGITALTGVLRATEQIPALSDLWSTSYGLVLVLKSAGVLAMLGLALTWRRGWPAARAEAAATMLVIASTALLAAYPLPRIG